MKIIHSGKLKSHAENEHSLLRSTLAGNFSIYVYLGKLAVSTIVISIFIFVIFYVKLVPKISAGAYIICGVIKHYCVFFFFVHRSVRYRFDLVSVEITSSRKIGGMPRILYCVC